MLNGLLDLTGIHNEAVMLSVSYSSFVPDTSKLEPPSS